MGKDKSTAKIASNASRHNPINHPTSGPQFFHNNFDETMGPSDSPIADLTPTTPTTPTPTAPHRELPPMGLHQRDVTPTHEAQPVPPHEPQMEPQPPAPPQTPHPLTAVPKRPLLTPSFSKSDNDLITSFMGVMERNRCMVLALPNVLQAKLAKYTPAPEKGFPIIHLASPGQLLADLSGAARREWIKVGHPKLLTRIFDYDGSDPTKMNPVITHRIKDIVNKVSAAYNAKNTNCIVSLPTPADGYPIGTSPNAFLIHNATEEVRDLLLSQHVWSSANLTFEACPFVEWSLPTLLLNLAGFTMDHSDVVQEVVQSTWTDPEVRQTISIILHDKDPFFQREDVLVEFDLHINTFINSVKAEFLNYKVAGGIETPCFNILVDSPTTSPDA
ncbi:hypothetical protein OG21DRAFT_1491956 [Imleria badia]|nr:hypothetical protein OG21DRAFT_1491956 [Imleria badia]